MTGEFRLLLQSKILLKGGFIPCFYTFSSDGRRFREDPRRAFFLKTAHLRAGERRGIGNNQSRYSWTLRETRHIRWKSLISKCWKRTAPPTHPSDTVHMQHLSNKDSSIKLPLSGKSPHYCWWMCQRNIYIAERTWEDLCSRIYFSDCLPNAVNSAFLQTSARITRLMMKSWTGSYLLIEFRERLR